MVELRFSVESPEALIDAARAADPPVEHGQHAELILADRRVLLRSSIEDYEVVWTEVL